MRRAGPGVLVLLLVPAGCGSPPPAASPSPAPLERLDLSDALEPQARGTGLAAAADLLARHLTHPDWEARESASKALESAGMDAMPLLARLFPRTDPEVSWRVRRALGRLGWPAEPLIARAADSGPEAAPLLASVLEADLIDRADPAIRALARMGPAGFDAVSPLASSREARTRYHAARALGLLADPRAIPLLEKLGRDAEQGVRFAAAGALMRQGRPEAYAALTASLRSQAQGESAATAVYNLGCAACLAGRLEEALGFLERSRGLGFSDLRALDGDPDLYELRRLPAWEALRLRLRSGEPLE